MFGEDVLAQYGFEKGGSPSDGDTICSGCWDQANHNFEQNTDIPAGEPIYWQRVSYEYAEYESYCHGCANRLVAETQKTCDSLWIEQVVETEQKVLSALRCVDGPKDSTKWWRERGITRAHTIDIIVRKDGREHRIEGDFLKRVARGMIELEMVEQEDD